MKPGPETWSLQSCNKLSTYSSFPMSTISVQHKVCRSKKVSTLEELVFDRIH